ncbi:MAG: hypothetical protein J6S81_03945, partial [Treponema sp.]|nr:hypothetical protein [Treponema sp.]
MILVIDNYDSFTYNVVQALQRLSGEEVKVVRSKECNLADLDAMNPDRLVVSPGPGTPSDAGISKEAIRHFAGKIPVLGICLGHQSIGEAFGAKIVQAKQICHGVVQEMDLDGRGVFRLVGKKASFTRYHSLVIDESTLPEDFEVTALSPLMDMGMMVHSTPIADKYDQIESYPIFHTWVAPLMAGEWTLPISYRIKDLSGTLPGAPITIDPTPGGQVWLKSFKWNDQT